MCPRLRYRNCTQAKYERKSDGEFVIQDLPEMPEIPWIVVDPLAPGINSFISYNFTIKSFKLFKRHDQTVARGPHAAL